VVSDWRDKRRELDDARVELHFDLVELAEIIESARAAFPQTAPSSGRFDRVKTAANYLLMDEKLPPAFIDLSGRAFMDEAVNTRDAAFLEAVVNRVKKKLTTQDVTPDNFKSFLVAHWAPRFVEKAFWPGLAYMVDRARIKAHPIFCRAKPDVERNASVRLG